MERLYKQKVISSTDVFDDHFYDAKNFFLFFFNQLPNVSFVNNIDGRMACEAFMKRFVDLIDQTYHYRWYKKEKKQYQFSRTILLLKNKTLIEFDEGSFEIFHSNNQEVFVQEATDLAGSFREREKRQPLEINLIVQGVNKLQLKEMEINRTKLDLDLFYEDDFKAVDATIRKRLGRKKERGIVLLHGLPGTGKTTYLRYLVGKIRKRVLFLSPSIAGNLMNPEFIELLISNPDTVVIIEDAENIIMDRKFSGGSSVSNLLNISDGLLADFLNVKLICTFNSSLTMIDNALMRKGRLIARYEFGKLGVEKSQRLSDHFGFDSRIEKPMTIAEIANQDEVDFDVKQVEVIGFRRKEEMVN